MVYGFAWPTRCFLTYINVGECPTRWTAVDGKCFRFMRSLRSWSEASSSCRAQNGKLAEIASLEIDSWISQKSAGRIWFSATDTKIEGDWTNEDGTELTAVF